MEFHPIKNDAPFGYKLIKDGNRLPNGRQPHKIVIDKNIGPQLKIIWELAAENKSLTAIGHELSHRGMTTAKGNEWRRQSLSNIIKNRFYKGYLH